MGFDKKRCRGIKGRRIYRREASQPDTSGLRGTQDHLRFDYSSTRTARNRRATTTATNTASDRARRFRFGFRRTRAGRPSDSIARIYGERNPRANERVNKQADKRADTKDVGKIEQGRPYLHEVPRRELRQKAWTSSCGKDSQKHRSQ